MTITIKNLVEKAVWKIKEDEILRFLGCLAAGSSSVNIKCQSRVVFDTKHVQGIGHFPKHLVSGTFQMSSCSLDYTDWLAATNIAQFSGAGHLDSHQVSVLQNL
ncbi:hypothetical protein ElyMa_003911000 [Elysia marginata]|uniref:Uncharacterized protein n=1 Tax=Elysia marginata TaxID=1093978 RepID=A0AAV4FP52_9GAST|nr:hypothetical protein ElyMa_003911000 [Elysia marginata]